MKPKEGIYLIDKESGWTSFDVVAKMRNMAGIKSIGHAGTLDPFATGLLIILAGKKFTKRQSKFMKLDKEYEAVLKLGYESTTGDPEGMIKKEKGKRKKYSREEIRNVLMQFIGKIEQTPPAYSAIKIQGERAYKKARKGEKFKIPKREITIYELKVISYAYPYIKFHVKCSSGTYIRSLAVDIAEKLGTKGYLTELRRTKIGEYSIKKAKRISKLSP